MNYRFESVMESISKAFQWGKIQIALIHLGVIIGLPLVPVILFASWLPVAAGVLGLVGLALSLVYVAPRMSFILVFLGLAESTPQPTTYADAKAAFHEVKWTVIFTSLVLSLVVGIAVGIVLLVTILLGLIPILGIVLNGLLFLPLVAIFFCTLLVVMFSAQVIVPLIAKYKGGMVQTIRKLVLVIVQRFPKFILFNTLASLLVTPLMFTILFLGLGAVIAALIPGITSLLGGLNPMSLMNPMAALSEMTEGFKGFVFLLFYGLGAGAVLAVLFSLITSVTTSVNVGVFLAAEEGFNYDAKIDPKTLSDSLKG